MTGSTTTALRKMRVGLCKNKRTTRAQPNAH